MNEVQYEHYLLSLQTHPATPAVPTKGGTMKVTLSTVEMYPVYVPDPDGLPYDIPTDLAERHREAFAAFSAVNDELRAHMQQVMLGASMAARIEAVARQRDERGQRRPHRRPRP